VARAVPSVDARLNALDTRHRSRLETLDDPERCADFTAEILREGLHSRGVDVYLGTAADTCCAGRSGYSAELTPPALEAAQRLTARRELAHLALEQGQRGPDADRLRREQVEIVAPLSCRDALVGFATVREADDGLPFTSRELIFVTRVCSRAAISIQNGLLAAELMRSERFATIGQIGAGLAHDLGKPLSVAYQRAQLLLRTEQLTPRVREQIRSMAAVTDEALTQIDALLERGSERTHEPKSSLVDVLERAVTTAQRLHAPDCVLLRPTPGLPEVSSPAALARALANLIDNGIEASAGSRVEVYATANADSTVIEVVDRGSGMDAATLHRAFEPFFTTRARHGGRGLGLSTARNLVEGMGGTLVLESAPGKGTTARISLPLRTSTDSVPKS
jgi:signal transduction histidine kinase